MDPGIVVPLGAFVMTIILALGIPLARGYVRRLDNQSKVPAIPAEVVTRLERMEQAIDAIAVEVERISEGQRFTTKLLSESARPAALPGSSDRSGDAA